MILGDAITIIVSSNVKNNTKNIQSTQPNTEPSSINESGL
mgnify:CR=1 FL=1